MCPTPSPVPDTAARVRQPAPYPPADLPDLTDPTVLVLTIPEVGAYFRRPRNSAYRAAQRGDWPTITVAGRLLVPAQFVREVLGVQVRDTSVA